MAEVKKHTHKGALGIFRHNERSGKNSSNADIKSELTCKNYDLLPQPKRLNLSGLSESKVTMVTAADRYKKRLLELYVYGRADVKTICSWVITAPKELKNLEQQHQFFKECARFMGQRYGMKNVVQAIVHMDEATPHLHFNFIPVVEDKKHGGEKVCANNVINREELRAFHPELQEHLKAAGITARVMTGVTKKQGGNRTVKQLKINRDRERGGDYGR